MIKKIVGLIKSEMGQYLFFGVLTTVVNYVSFCVFRLILGDSKILMVNTIAFILSSLFAFVTNKIFVFKACSLKFVVLLREIVGFFATRLFSFFIEQFGLYICANVMHLEKYKLLSIDCIMIAKIVLSFVAVLLNWIASKYIIFKKKV